MMEYIDLQMVGVQSRFNWMECTQMEQLDVALKMCIKDQAVQYSLEMYQIEYQNMTWVKSMDVMMHQSRFQIMISNLVGQEGHHIDVTLVKL